MKHSFVAACGAVTLASTMILSAQTPATPTTSPAPPAPTQLSTLADHGAITVAGCLKAWDSTMGKAPADPMAKPGDPTPTTGTLPFATTRYVLTDIDAVAPLGIFSPATESTPTTSAGAPAHPKASQYIVTAAVGLNLAAHLNHTVRVTGSLDAPSPMAHAAGGTPMPRPGEPTPSTGMAGDKQWSTLAATSVSMISNTCTPKS